MASAPRRSRVTTVSTRDSPFEIAEPLPESEITSAPHLRAASSKETAVRVEASKKARQMVLPASEPVMRPSSWAAARSKISLNSFLLVCSSERKPLAPNDDHPVLPVCLLQVDQHPLTAGGRHVFPDMIRPDRKLPVPPVHEDGEPHGLARHVKRHAAALYLGLVARKIVAVERDVH